VHHPPLRPKGLEIHPAAPHQQTPGAITEIHPPGCSCLLADGWVNTINVMVEINDQLLNEIVDRLVEALHPQEIYLFGSQASGKTHRRSDLDLFLVVDDDAGDLHELAGRGYIELSRIGVAVDLVLYRRRSMEKWAAVKFSLPYEVTRKGRRIYAA